VCQGFVGGHHLGNEIGAVVAHREVCPDRLDFRGRELAVDERGQRFQIDAWRRLLSGLSHDQTSPHPTHNASS
jgi:hypothetical protein